MSETDERRSLNKAKALDRNLCEKSHDYFREYCDNTTIHGFKYLDERGRSWTEKLWWMAILVVCFFYCYDLSMKTYDKWMLSPIIVGFKQSPVPVWDIPFPAVTVCPQTKAKQSVCNYTALYNEWKNNEKLTQEDMEKLAALSLVCSKHGPTTDLSGSVNDSILEFLAGVAPQLEDMKPTCGWRQNNSIPCDKLLTPVFTVEGLCYTFNTLDRRDLYTDVTAHYKDFGLNNRRIKGWDYERGYENQLGIRTYPYRDLFLSRKSLDQSGFFLDIGVHERDTDYLCRGADQGFKIFLNHPAEVLRHGQQYFFAPLDQVAEIILLPEMMITSDELKPYSPSIRECYYPTEKPLKFFKTYTKRNCEMECMAKLLHEYLECVSFYMPREKDWLICDSSASRQIDMYRDLNVAMKEAFNFGFGFQHMGKMLGKDLGEAFRDLFKTNELIAGLAQEFNMSLGTLMDSLNLTEALGADNFINAGDEFDDEIIDFDFDELGIDIARFQCDCRPSCRSISYSAKKFLKDFNWYQQLLVADDKRKNISQYDGMHFSRIMVVYTDNKIQTSERKALFGTEDFIGNIGGLLGLFTGFSFLSAFEILYYLTLRLWCNVRERGRNRR